MSIFNLLELQKSAGEIKMSSHSTSRFMFIRSDKSLDNSKIMEDYIFTTELDSILEAGKLVDSNIAYYESILENEDLDSSMIEVVRQIIDKYIEIFDDISETLNKKVGRIKEVYTNKIEKLQNTYKDKDLTITIKHFEYTNLSYISTYASFKCMVRDALEGMNNCTGKEFRSMVRSTLLDTEDPINNKDEYLLALYKFFRGGFSGNEEDKKIFLLKRDDIIENTATIFYKIVPYFSNEIHSITDYLKSIRDNDHLCNLEFEVDIILKNLEIIFEEYVLLYAARADAICEMTNAFLEFVDEYILQYKDNI